MTTAAAECFAIVTDWRRQFGAALPTAVPQILVLGDLQVGLRSGGRFCKGPIQHDALSFVVSAFGDAGLVTDKLKAGLREEAGCV
jgi:hypothetical protein